MPPRPKRYGILERLPPDLQYLKRVVWKGWEITQRWEEALHDDNPEYTARVLNTMRQHMQRLSPAEQVREALHHRRLIDEFTREYNSENYPEMGALFFISGLLPYAEGLF